MLEIGQRQSLGFSVAITYGLAEQNLLVLESPEPLEVVTSGLLGGNLQKARYVFNQTVPKTYHADSPLNDLMLTRARITPEDEAVGLLTAVDVRHTTVKIMGREGLKAAVLCTAGISNGSSAGLPLAEISANYRPGTINLIIAIEGNLARGALVNGVITATEAKVRALYEYGLRFPGNRLMTGTTTDTVTILCTGKGAEIPYAGTGTELGYYIGGSVYAAVWQGLELYFGKAS